MGFVFPTVAVMIGHTQERLTADHKWMPGEGFTSGKGLKQDKPVATLLENKGVDVVFTSRAVTGKGEECVTIDFKGLHIVCSKSLKRLAV